MKDSGPIFKTPWSRKKQNMSTELVPASTGKSPVAIDASYEIVTPATRVEREDLGVESRITRYHIKREREELELAKLRGERIREQLDAAHDELDLMNLQALFNGEEGCVPKRRR